MPTNDYHRPGKERTTSEGVTYNDTAGLNDDGTVRGSRREEADYIVVDGGKPNKY